MDLWFAVDGSEGVESDQFENVLGFVSNVASRLNVSQTSTRVGLSVYSDRNEVVASLEDTTNWRDFQALVNSSINLKSKF